MQPCCGAGQRRCAPAGNWRCRFRRTPTCRRSVSLPPSPSESPTCRRSAGSPQPTRSRSMCSSPRRTRSCCTTSDSPGSTCGCRSTRTCCPAAGTWSSGSAGRRWFGSRRSSIRRCTQQFLVDYERELIDQIGDHRAVLLRVPPRADVGSAAVGLARLTTNATVIYDALSYGTGVRSLLPNLPCVADQGVRHGRHRRRGRGDARHGRPAAPDRAASRANGPSSVRPASCGN